MAPSNWTSSGTRASRQRRDAAAARRAAQPRRRLRLRSRSGLVRITVELEIEITFGEFGWSGVEEQARAEGLELERFVALACSYWASGLAAERAATVVPRLGESGVERETRTLVIELGAESLRRLEQEAERQGLAVERLCEHAALLYLADFDTGRLAEQIVRHTGG